MRTNQFILVQQQPPPIFGTAMMHDAAVIVRRATAGNELIRLKRLHRILQQRFPNLTVDRTYHLIFKLTQLGLIDN